MAFRKKADLILKFQPDILVVPECEHPDKLKFLPGTQVPTDISWYGTNAHKGMGIFSYSNYKLKLLDCYNPEFKMIVPFQVIGGKTDFVLFAVWANNPNDKAYQYIGQVWKAIHFYEDLLHTEKVILTGDFNSNTFWDKPKRVWNHSAVVEVLEKKKIYSMYHQFFGSRQGKEKHNTLFMYRHKDKPYHIDYCFASHFFTEKLTEVKVGTHHRWKKYSDHTPLIVTFQLPPQELEDTDG